MYKNFWNKVKAGVGKKLTNFKMLILEKKGKSMSWTSKLRKNNRMNWNNVEKEE